MKNKVLWGFAIAFFLGTQVGVGIGYHAMINWMDSSLEVTE